MNAPAPAPAPIPMPKTEFNQWALDNAAAPTFNAHMDKAVGDASVSSVPVGAITAAGTAIAGPAILRGVTRKLTGNAAAATRVGNAAGVMLNPTGAALQKLTSRIPGRWGKFLGAAGAFGMPMAAGAAATMADNPNFSPGARAAANAAQWVTDPTYTGIYKGVGALTNDDGRAAAAATKTTDNLNKLVESGKPQQFADQARQNVLGQWQNEALQRAGIGGLAGSGIGLILGLLTGRPLMGLMGGAALGAGGGYFSRDAQNWWEHRKWQQAMEAANQQTTPQPGVAQ